MKECNTCHVVQSLDKFQEIRKNGAYNFRQPIYRHNKCRGCRTADRREYYKRITYPQFVPIDIKKDI